MQKRVMNLRLEQVIVLEEPGEFRGTPDRTILSQVFSL